MKKGSNMWITLQFLLNSGSIFQTIAAIPIYLCRRVSTADFAKGRGRDASTFYRNLEYSPDYAPNFEFGRKQLGSCGSKFDKVSPRRPVHYVSASNNQDFLDTEAVYKNEKSQFFER